MPVRIQRKRVKGWRMPAGVVYVGRPSKWGNPYVMKNNSLEERRTAMAFYREHLRQHPELVEAAQKELRGKDIACACLLEEECHGDILLGVANTLIGECLTPAEEDLLIYLPGKPEAEVESDIIDSAYCDFCGRKETHGKRTAFYIRDVVGMAVVAAQNTYCFRCKTSRTLLPVGVDAGLGFSGRFLRLVNLLSDEGYEHEEIEALTGLSVPPALVPAQGSKSAKKVRPLELVRRGEKGEIVGVLIRGGRKEIGDA